MTSLRPPALSADTPEGAQGVTIADAPLPNTTLFAANMADPIESSIAPKPELIVSGKKGGDVAGFTVGVRRELWIYLLLAVAILSAVEWATYHRRITV